MILYLISYKLKRKDIEKFKNPDNDPRGPWVSTDFTAQGWRPNQMYEITTASGKAMTPPEGRCWRHLGKRIPKSSRGTVVYGLEQMGAVFQEKKTYLSEKEGKGCLDMVDKHRSWAHPRSNSGSCKYFGGKQCLIIPNRCAY